GDHGDDVGRGLGGAGVDAGDPGVGVGAPHHGQVQHPLQLHVVGPPGAAGDEALVLLAAAVPADLPVGGVLLGGAVVGDGHACSLPWVAVADPEPAACSTALTMLW